MPAGRRRLRHRANVEAPAPRPTSEQNSKWHTNGQQSGRRARKDSRSGAGGGLQLDPSPRGDQLPEHIPPHRPAGVHVAADIKADRWVSAPAAHPPLFCRAAPDNYPSEPADLISFRRKVAGRLRQSKVRIDPAHEEWPFFDLGLGKPMRPCRYVPSALLNAPKHAGFGK